MTAIIQLKNAHTVIYVMIYASTFLTTSLVCVVGCDTGISYCIIQSIRHEEMSPCQAVDMMQMDPDYCLRRLTETVYNHVCLLVVVLAGTDG